MCASVATSSSTGASTPASMAAPRRKFRNYTDGKEQKRRGFRRGSREGVTVGLLLSSYGLGEVGDGVKSTRITGGSTEPGSDASVLGLHGLVLAVEEVDGVEVVLLQ